MGRRVTKSLTIRGCSLPTVIEWPGVNPEVQSFCWCLQKTEEETGRVFVLQDSVIPFLSFVINEELLIIEVWPPWLKQIRDSGFYIRVQREAV